MTKKQVLACAIIACVIIAVLGGSFLWIKSDPQKDQASSQTTSVANAATTTTEYGKDGKGEDATTDADDADDADDPGDGSYDKENEVANFAIPTDKKESFASDQKYRFDAQAGQFGVTVNRIQTREHNWESYPYGPENKFVEGSTDSQWVSIIKLREKATGMTDAAAFPIRATDPEEAYEEVITEKTRCVAWAVGVADFMSNWLYADGTKFSETNPELVDFVKENDAAQARAKEKKQLTAQLDRLRYKSDADDQKKAVQEKIAKLDEQGCGVGRWLDATDDPWTAELNDEFITYLAIEINIMDEFHIVGIQNVTSEVNYHQTITGDVDQIKLVENKSYQEINQPALVMGMLDKNGKVSMKWGLDTRDGRPLKVLEWSKNPSNPKNIKKKTTTTTTNVIINQDSNTTINNNNNNENNNENNNNNDNNITIVVPPTEPDKPDDNTPPSDGNGSKNQSEGSAFQNNADRNSGTHLASDGDGEKTEEPQQTNTTVVEGSAESGRRSLNEQEKLRTGDSSAQVPAQQATNGSTESTDTSSREAAGTVDSSGATVDNQGNSSDTNSSTFTVPEAARETATPTTEAQAGYTPPED